MTAEAAAVVTEAYDPTRPTEVSGWADSTDVVDIKAGEDRGVADPIS
jgi:hypothetical protein